LDQQPITKESDAVNGDLFGEFGEADAFGEDCTNNEVIGENEGQNENEKENANSLTHSPQMDLFSTEPVVQSTNDVTNLATNDPLKVEITD
jgi:hypothetical protein